MFWRNYYVNPQLTLRNYQINNICMNKQNSRNYSYLILVVDDSESIRSMLRQALEQEGYQVMEANNGKQCLEICSLQLPDMILLDAMMPEMDGFTCCAKLQEIFEIDLSGKIAQDLLLENDSLFYIPPVLMITALEDKKSIELAFSMGAIDYITKPIQWAVLSQRVRRILHTNKLVKELKQQTERWRLLTVIQERIRYSLNLNDILETTVKQVRNFLKTDRVLIYQFKPDGSGEIVMESVNDGWKSVLDGTGRDVTFTTKNIQHNPSNKLSIPEDKNVADLTPYHIQFLNKFQVKANLIVPISKTNTEQFIDSEFDYTREELWGLLIAHHCSASRQWQSSEIEFIERLVAQLAIALQQSELYQQLEMANQKLIKLATMDSLTNVANRRLFDEYLEREWRRMARDKTPISLILCDVDYFKLYNDTYGHPAGDRCLQQVANTIKLELKRPADLVARYGGEEFAVVLPQTDIKGGFHLAELIRRRLKALKLVNHASKISQFVTMSLGVATTIPLSGSSAEKLIQQADEALYQAKREGRDRTIVNTF